MREGVFDRGARSKSGTALGRSDATHQLLQEGFAGVEGDDAWSRRPRLHALRALAARGAVVALKAGGGSVNGRNFAGGAGRGLLLEIDVEGALAVARARALGVGPGHDISPRVVELVDQLARQERAIRAELAHNAVLRQLRAHRVRALELGDVGGLHRDGQDQSAIVQVAGDVALLTWPAL